jgi:acetoin utilization deacetylase AcuC-like enzyme
MLDNDFPVELSTLKPRLATMDDLELVHTPVYIQKVLKTADYDFTYLAPDTPACAKTYLAAWLAVGACLSALDHLMSKGCQYCFALVRPPGHHALPDRASGFCIFNNLGVTARYAQKVYGLERILIVDWDVHHGNGVQQLFYAEKEVLYFSSHYISSFPQTGDWQETGEGAGLGYTVNIPLMKNLEDEDILHCYREVLGPIIRRYKPQIIMVAAGFDAHRDDPLARTKLTETAYGWLTRLIMDSAAEIGGPPVLLALEGGYDALALAASVKQVLLNLAAPEAQLPLPEPFTPRGAEMVARALRSHAKYGVWVDPEPARLAGRQWSVT